MDAYKAAEAAYKNGYEQGKKDAVKHGQWVKKVESYHDTHTDEYWDEEYCSCPLCGKDSDLEHNYCPNCGAIMDMKGE